MKKNILIYMFVLLCCFMGLKTVSANNQCSYGFKNDSGDWKGSQIVFTIYSWNDVKLNAAESKYFIDKGVKSFSNCSAKENCTQKGVQKEFGPNDDFYIYISMFATEDIYELNKGECPKVIKMGYRHEGTINNLYHYIIHNDDLDESDIDNDFWRNLHEDQDDSWYLILDTEKDTPLEEIVDPYNCSTYYNYKLAIVNSVENSKSKSCDNNNDFNNYYQKLRGLCDNYRSTSIYVESTDDAIVATACNKACSMLKDDVAEICSAYPEGGYCGSFGNELVNWFIRVLNILRYAIPALLIILSVLDYIKAIAADSDDEMKKVNKRFINRLIAGAAIFLVPFILNFLLGMFDIPGLNADNPFCAK